MTGRSNPSEVFFRDVLLKSSKNMQQIYRRAAVPSDFNKVAKHSSKL